MSSDNLQESSIDGVLNRSIDALSDMVGFKTAVTLNDTSNHVDDACVDDTIVHQTILSSRREQKEIEREVFRNFWTAIDGFLANKPFNIWHNKFVLKAAIESFDFKQCQNGRVDTLSKKMSIKARYTAKDDIDRDTSVGKGDNSSKSGTNITCLCHGTVVQLIQDESENDYVILACYGKLAGNKYFICQQDECQPLLESSNQPLLESSNHQGETNSKTIENLGQSGKSKTKNSRTDTVRLHDCENGLRNNN
jgi:hypothetical protein